MENNKKLNAGAIIGIIVLTVLSAAALVSYIIASLDHFSGAHLYAEIIPIAVLFLAVAYYAAFGYRKPHGDLLRFVFLLFSARNFVAVISDVLTISEEGMSDPALFSKRVWGIVFRGVTIILIAYIGGRLDKIRKNAVPLAIVLASHIANFLIWEIPHFAEFNIPEMLWRAASLIFCIDLIVAYAFRYRAHKEAGLADKN